jgi:hypothetical protein
MCDVTRGCSLAWLRQSTHAMVAPVTYIDEEEPRRARGRSGRLSYMWESNHSSMSSG